MSITKHKTFKIRISDDGKFILDKSVENSINAFLAEPNNVYINHSVSTLSEDIDIYGSQKTIIRFVIISLVYKDLNETALNLKGTSKRIQKNVRKEIKKDSKIDEPSLETAIDAEIQKLTITKKT